MTINENFVLRQVSTTWVVLPLGSDTVDFHGMVTLNESGVFLWKILEKGCTREDLANALTQEYTVDYAVALQDVDAFLNKLMKTGCIID